VKRSEVKRNIMYSCASWQRAYWITANHRHISRGTSLLAQCYSIFTSGSQQLLSCAATQHVTASSSLLILIFILPH
jgi:hypothetical protein